MRITVDPDQNRLTADDNVLVSSITCLPENAGLLINQQQNGIITGRIKLNAQSDLPPTEVARVEFQGIEDVQHFLAFHQAVSDTWTWPLAGSDLLQVPIKTAVLLYQRTDGVYGCIIPLVDGPFKGEINARTDALGIDLHSFNSGLREVDAAAFALAYGDNPYDLVRRCFEAGMEALGHPGRMRWQKTYPEALECIGWCTWDAFYKDVNEQGILEKLEHAKQAGFPFRFVLIDDGWSPTRDEKLTGFGVDGNKFPDGLAALIEQCKDNYGVRSVGVWHAYTGYWGGVAEGSDVHQSQRENLLRTRKGWYIPYPQTQKSFAFWNAWHGRLREEGVDFLKVDNQGCLYDHAAHVLGVGEASRGMQHGLQASVGLNFNGAMINCMCMQNVNVWHWAASNVSRSSRDFMPEEPERDRLMAYQNIYNSLWYSNFTWPDFDMFWTDHPQARFHAAMRAISGGPVYVSDKADSADWDVLRPLILSDGRLLRCDRPALPCRDSLFHDVEHGPHAVKAFNTAGRCGVAAVFHASDCGGRIKSSISSADVEGLAGEQFAVREFFTGETRLLRAAEEWIVELEPFECRFFVFSHVENGFAPIGLASKYVSPKTILNWWAAEDRASVALAEGGRFIAYSQRDVTSVEADSAQVSFAQTDGWLEIEVPLGTRHLYICF